MNLCKWFYWGMRNQMQIPQCIIDSLCCLTPQQFTGIALHGLTSRRHKQGRKALPWELLDKAQSSSRKRRLLIFALEWISLQKFALQEKLWERVNLSGFKSQASMELLRVLSKQAVLGYFMGAHQPRESFWRKISAEIAVFVRLLAVKVL